MLRYLLLLVTAVLSAIAYQQLSSPQVNSLDPAFRKIPLDQWLSEANQTRFHWTVNIDHAALTFHQRLMTRIDVEVDGRDLETRRDHGRLVFFLQISDHDGNRYQDHGSIELNKLDQNIKAAIVQSAQRVFILPGDYRLAVALLDTGSGDHATLQTKFHVSGPSSNWFVSAWKDLPAVEFIREEQSPDSWYLPDVQGRLQWAASLPSPARLNVILNLGPAGALAALLPTLKVVSQAASADLSERIELLDLARRRSVFQASLQEAGGTLDWPTLKSSLGEANTASIDLHSLSERHHDAQFFVAQVRRVLRTAEKPGILVILSAPIAFEPGEDLTQISLEDLPASRVFYIRYQAALARVLNPFERPTGGRGRGMPSDRNRPMPAVIDQLAATLKPLNPKLIDVSSPDEITKTLMAIQKSLTSK